MNNNLVFMSMVMAGTYSKELSYSGLTKEEKENLKFMDECIFGDNKKISDASFNIMMMILKLMDKPDAYTPEDVQVMKNEIYKDLNKEEIKIMENFTLACINSIGVCSKKRENERKLIKRRDEK